MAEGKVLVVDDEEHIVELLKFNFWSLLWNKYGV